MYNLLLIYSIEIFFDLNKINLNKLNIFSIYLIHILFKIKNN